MFCYFLLETHFSEVLEEYSPMPVVQLVVATRVKLGEGHLHLHKHYLDLDQFSSLLPHLILGELCADCHKFLKLDQLIIR